jgi:glucosamine-6-phosphate deaminase
MQIHKLTTEAEAGRFAAGLGAGYLTSALAARGAARVILATGSSQFEMLAALTATELDWSRVTIFHLDEYLGLAAGHPAAFRRYLRDRVLAKLPMPPAAFVGIDGLADPTAECDRLAALITAAPIDLCLCGIGENGHLAFNDPPADFTTTAPYLVVNLDEACRRQQVGEGWFGGLDDVPSQAISMSIHQIMASAAIVCTVPGGRKAAAVAACLSGAVRPEAPASCLQSHPECHVVLDAEAAGLLPA